jgi:hypothetical protein
MRLNSIVTIYFSRINTNIALPVNTSVKFSFGDNMIRSFLAVFSAVLLLSGCHERPPVNADGSAVLELHAL